MPDEKKTTTRTRTPTPAKQREQMIEEAVHDFSYKAEFTDEQRAAWMWVNNAFHKFNTEMMNLFDFSKIKKQITQTHDYKAFIYCSRKAERWANAAIANDWKHENAFDIDNASGLEYPIIAEARDEQQRLCNEVSKRCFELVTLMLRYLPLGRHTSLFKTEMQVARGWLIDCINRNS